MKRYLIVVGVIAILFILRFGVIPQLSKTQVVAPLCTSITLKELSENASLIIIGEAVSERMQTIDFFNRGTIFTYTTIGNIDVVNGNLTGAAFEAKQSGGCDPLTGYCVYTSIMSPFEAGKKYLLFLKPALKYQPMSAETPPSAPGEKGAIIFGEIEIEEGVYAGFSGCGGKYLISENISNAEVKAIVYSGNEARWQTFLGALSQDKKWNDVLPRPAGQPGVER